MAPAPLSRGNIRISNPRSRGQAVRQRAASSISQTGPPERGIRAAPCSFATRTNSSAKIVAIAAQRRYILGSFLILSFLRVGPERSAFQIIGDQPALRTRQSTGVSGSSGRLCCCRVGLNRPEATYAATAVAATQGWKTARGTAYFFDRMRASITPRAFVLGRTPGICGITKSESCKSARRRQ